MREKDKNRQREIKEQQRGTIQGGCVVQRKEHGAWSQRHLGWTLALPIYFCTTTGWVALGLCFHTSKIRYFSKRKQYT